MRNRELIWGLLFLFASVFFLFISLWKFFVYLEHSYILLFKIGEYLFFVYSLVITSAAIAAMVRSFYYARTDLT